MSPDVDHSGPEGLEEGEEIRVDYERRGRLPDHHDRERSYTLEVQRASPRTGTIRAQGPDDMHRDGVVHVHRDGGVYVAYPDDPDLWSVQLGTNATVRRER